eukprot:scaffold7404_cov286-Pinguiococcus_pyrenoidosus.AAC.4
MLLSPPMNCPSNPLHARTRVTCGLGMAEAQSSAPKGDNASTASAAHHHRAGSEDAASANGSSSVQESDERGESVSNESDATPDAEPLVFTRDARLVEQLTAFVKRSSRGEAALPETAKLFVVVLDLLRSPNARSVHNAALNALLSVGERFPALLKHEAAMDDVGESLIILLYRGRLVSKTFQCMYQLMRRLKIPIANRFEPALGKICQYMLQRHRRYDVAQYGVYIIYEIRRSTIGQSKQGLDGSEIEKTMEALIDTWLTCSREKGKELGRRIAGLLQSMRRFETAGDPRYGRPPRG